MDACPACGSHKGWYQKATWRSQLLGDWKTMETAPPYMEVTWISTIVRCVVCDKGFSLERLERLHEESE